MIQTSRVGVSIVGVSICSIAALRPARFQRRSRSYLWGRKLTCSLALRPRGGPVIERQRRNGPSREAARALAQSGAPRSMKTGTIVSPWHYDTAAAQAIRSDNVRRTAMLSYARSTTLLSMSLVPWLSIDCGLARSGMHGSGAESTLTNHANFGIICS